jgi:GxxExxY protein
MSDRLQHGELAERVLKAFYHVYNTLGYGFLEKVYQNALAITLRKQGLRVETGVPINVYFEGEVVGEYWADVIVEGCVILEIKSARALNEAHQYQLINYLRATRISVGLVLNFGPQPQFVRKVV